MKTGPTKSSLARMAVLLIAIFFIITGCAGSPHPKPLVAPQYKARFDEKIDRLISDIMEKGKFSAAEMSPAAVMPGSLKSGQTPTRLEEVIMERLGLALLKHHELVSLSRSNWFEFREGRPLSFRFTKGYDPAVLRSLVIYVVNVSADPVMEEMRATISAYNSKNRMIAGMTASTRLAYAPDRPGRMLYESSPQRDAFPEGLEEHPYTSEDRLCFSLAGELADAYKTGIETGDGIAADKEIKVLLYVKRQPGVDSSLANSIGNTLQQAVVANRGFTCVVSQSDFGPAFDQVDFYKAHQPVFKIDDPRFLPGTVFLMAEVYPHQSGKKVGVALRALWRLSPLEDKSGAFVSEETAGTYLSGFTAKAYLTAACNAGGEVAAPSYKNAPSGSMATASLSTVPPAVSYAPLKNYTLCFYGFNAPMERRIYPVISRVPGLQSIRRSDDACKGAGGCIGYALHCRCDKAGLSRWIEQNLRSSGDSVVPFRMDTTAEDTLKLYYNGGFE